VFVQVIEGRVGDRDGLRRQLDRWESDLRPGAKGFLGSTAGVADDGRGICLARFDSAAAAKANSDRPEQGQWWAETEKCFDGPVNFSDSEDVQTFGAGGSNDAGFVQIMEGRGIDRAQLQALDKSFDEYGPSFRPDLIGALRVWTGPDTYVEVGYFTSEAEAREGEKKEPPPEIAAQIAEFEKLAAKIEFIDLRDPWLY